MKKIKKCGNLNEKKIMVMYGNRKNLKKWKKNVIPEGHL